MYTWQPQVEKTCRQAFGAPHKIRLCGHFMSKNLKYRLVQSLVTPYFRYCDVIYSDMTTALESNLQRAQNPCVRFICRLKKFDHIAESYKELNMPRLEQIRRIFLQKLGWKILKGEAPTYFRGYFKFLRSRIRSKDLEVPKHRTTQYTTDPSSCVS